MRNLLIAFLAGMPALPVAAAPGAAYDYEQCAREGGCRKAAEAELDRIRGGFVVDTPVGRLEIAIGITRAVAVNDQLVAVSQLVLPDVAHIIAAARAQAEVAKASGMAAAQAAAAAAAQAAAQALTDAGAGKPSSAAQSAQQAAMASSGQASASAQASAGAQASPGAPGQGVAGTGSGGASALPPLQVVINGTPVVGGNPVNLASGALVVQNGPGNGAPLPTSFNGTALPTVIQNSLNDQVLKTLTLINASVNSLAAFKAHLLSEALSRATAASGR